MYLYIFIILFSEKVQCYPVFQATCQALQHRRQLPYPHHQSHRQLLLTEIQKVMIPMNLDTVFAMKLPLGLWLHVIIKR